MTARSSVTTAWKERLHAALTLDAQSTADLVRRCAVPRPQAHKLLNELRDEGVAVKSYLPRPMRGSGIAPTGWRLRETVNG